MYKTLAALAVLALALTGCATAGGDDVDTNERGNIIKTVGETAGYMPGQCDDERCIEFTVTSIAEAQPCENPLNPIEGKLLDIDLDITTAPSAPSSELIGTFQVYNWSVLDASGTTRSNGSGELASPCNADPQNIGGELNPGSHYEGTIQLDVPDDAQSVMLTIPGGTSWEWEIPA